MKLSIASKVVNKHMLVGYVLKDEKGKFQYVKLSEMHQMTKSGKIANPAKIIKNPKSKPDGMYYVYKDLDGSDLPINSKEDAERKFSVKIIKAEPDGYAPIE